MTGSILAVAFNVSKQELQRNKVTPANRAEQAGRADSIQKTTSNAQLASRTRARRGTRSPLRVDNVVRVLSRDVSDYHFSSSDPKVMATVNQFVGHTQTLHIRDGYACASFAEARTLLEEAAAILGSLARLEHVSADVSATSSATCTEAAAEAFLAHPLIHSASSVPDYGAVTELPSEVIDAPVTDLHGLLSLNQDLLDSYFGVVGSPRPADDMRTAVARTLLTAAGGAMEAAVAYLSHAFDVGTVQVFAAYLDTGSGTQASAPAQHTENLFRVANGINVFAKQLPTLMITGHNTLTASGRHATNVNGSNSTDIANDVDQSPLGMQALERKQRMAQWLQIPDIDGYVSEFYHPLNLVPTPAKRSNFRFASNGVSQLANLLAILDTLRLDTTAQQLIEFRASRDRRARREEKARQQALGVSVVDPERPLSTGRLMTALSYLANEPGESGYLTVDCEANAQIKLITAKIGGSVRMSYRMSNWGSLMLGFDAGASARLGINAGVVDAGAKGETTIARTHKFTSHEQAAQFIYASLRGWIEALSDEVGPALWNYVHFEDADPVDPSKLGKTVTDTKRSATADASAKLGTSKVGGSLGKTWIDRHSVDENGKESRMKISLGSASVFANATVGNVGVGISGSATKGEVVKEDQDAPFEFVSLGAGIDLTFSGGLGKDTKWENQYSQNSKDKISKAVGKSLERVREFLVATFPQLARSPSLTRRAWKSLRKEMIAEINKSAKGSRSAKMQFSLTASLTREARGTTDDGELDTHNTPFTLSYMRLMLTSSHKRSMGVNAKVFGVSASTSVGKAESLRIWLGDNSLAYCKTLYKTSGSKPGAPTGLWKQLLEENPTEAFESMYGAVWNNGKGPIGVGSAGEDFMELFLRMKEDELVRYGTVKFKTDNQAPEYLALLENCLERSADQEMFDIATVADLDMWDDDADGER